MIQFTEQECHYLIDELRTKVPRDDDERMMLSDVMNKLGIHLLKNTFGENIDDEDDL
jgi:HD-like signal output (HDOD) protein|tara:strand:+ start:64 stop:234 length:171 start_codon:yes stop_codon:yes gene_type:complete